jgi:Flp pilus assembly protein TadG
VVVLVALAMPVMLGLTAFAVDVSQWSSKKNAIQAAADNSVLSAVMTAAQAGSTLAQITNQANAVAAATGFTNGASGVTVTVNNPPTSGPNSANTSAYEVIITQPQTRYFAVLLGTAPTVSGRAVALVGSKPACLLALDTTASSAITMSGGASVGAPNCAVAANSSSGTAVTGSGGASLSAANLNIVGNYSTSGGFTIAPSTKIKTGAPATADPYASLAVPAVGACTPPTPGAYTLSGGSSATINPGVYCGGINLSGGATLTMNPGVYIMNGGSFSMSGGTTVTASGVSIVLTNQPGGSGSWGTVSLSGGAHLTLTPPTSGPMQGVAFYVDRNAPTSGSDNFSGGAHMVITGSIYVPSQHVSYSGGAAAGSGCLQLIARTISFSGGSSFGTSCGSLNVPGLQPPPGTKGRPVE